MILAFLLALLIPSLVPSLADAACSGSGQTWTCPANSTVADVNAALGNATDGATITFAAGSYNWSGGTVNNFDPAKGVTLICVSTHACVVTVNQDIMQIYALTANTTVSSLFRISGFRFQGGPWNSAGIWFAANGSFLQFRIDHNWFDDISGGAQDIMIGAVGVYGKYFGVIDHNTFSTTTAGRDNRMAVKVLGTADTDLWSSVKGTGNNVVVEDNTINWVEVTNNGLACLDTWDSHGVVWRYNTMTNCRVGAHGTTHGGGAINWEVYRNSFTLNSGAVAQSMGDCWRTLSHQGSGEIFAWGNTFSCVNSPISASAISVTHYRDTNTTNNGAAGAVDICDGTNGADGNTAPTGTYRGYPCWMQPGRAPSLGSPHWGTLSPVAAFLNVNLADNSKVPLEYGCPWASPQYCAEHVQANRNYYDAVSATAQTSSSSPFDGTSGIGHGTLANRPTTCTHTTDVDGDNGGGVMYWATDQGSWNQSGSDGVLYRCSSTNTWTVHYTPYTYPHPLVGVVAYDPGSTGTGSITVTGGVSIQ